LYTLASGLVATIVKELESFIMEKKKKKKKKKKEQPKKKKPQKK